MSTSVPKSHDFGYVEPMSGPIDARIRPVPAPCL